MLGRREASWRKWPWSRGLRGGGHAQGDLGVGSGECRGMEQNHLGSPRGSQAQTVGPAASPGQIGSLWRMRQWNAHFRKNPLPCAEGNGGGGHLIRGPWQGGGDAGSGRTGPEPSRVRARGSSAQPLGCRMCLVDAVAVTQTQLGRRCRLRTQVWGDLAEAGWGGSREAPMSWEGRRAWDRVCKGDVGAATGRGEMGRPSELTWGASQLRPLAAELGTRWGQRP